MKNDVKGGNKSLILACVPTVGCAALVLLIVLLKTHPFSSLVHQCSIPSHLIC